MTSGIHHVTLITADVQANVDFYVGFLGLRLVKRTGGYEDARQLHLFYGDWQASPGSLLTFLVWQGGAAGQAGAGQVSEVALALAPGSIGYWVERALRFQVRSEGTEKEFGETVLRLRDPDGVPIKLVSASLAAPAGPTGDIPPEHAIRRIRGVTLLSEVQEQTAAFLSRYFGFSAGPVEGSVQRLTGAAGDVIDIRDAAGFWPGAPGTGTIDHVAVRATDAAQVAAVEAALRQRNASLTTLHDRHYFTSLYVREPGGVLVEMASDGPGFTVDEPLATLGSALFVPPDTPDPDAVKVMLPQFGLPGEARVVYRDLIYEHRFHTPAAPDGTTIALLHGTGGDETDLMPLAHRAAPHATLLGLRGRSTETGTRRWFKSFGPAIFDQKDLRFEAGALAAFLAEARRAYGIEAQDLVALGYSNGANLLAAALFLHKWLVRRAVLLRPVMALDAVPSIDLTDTAVLIVVGEHDAYREQGEVLATALAAAGAAVRLERLDAGHGLVDADAAAVGAWLAGEAEG